MFRSIVIEIVNSPVLFFVTLFACRACLWVVAETSWRARSISYGRVAPKDFAAELFHVFLVIPGVIFVYDRLFSPNPLQLSVPLLFRIGLYLIATDFAYYWVHRLMHMPS
jgi:sterol desaturase/sphingolipid hydroxylase (fatty acid hydroxylase superfamily)